MFSLPPKAAISAGAISLVAADLLSSVASSRHSFQVQRFNQHAEDHVVHDRIANTDNREQPQLAAVAGKNDKVDQTVRERRPVTHTQQDTDRECRPARIAWMIYRIGATNMKENSIGSVIPVRNEVSAAEIIIPPTLARFSGLAECQIAIAAAGRTF